MNLGRFVNRPYNVGVDEVLDAVWYILENPAQHGEYVVLDSVRGKLSPVWLSEGEARGFLTASPAALGMSVAELRTFILKEAYLLALEYLEVSHVVFDYQPGRPQAAVLALAQLYERLTQRLRSD